MINWVALFFHACWIFGASLLLAHFSYSRWASNDPLMQEQTPFQLSIGSIVMRISAWILIGIGAAASAEALWESLVWVAVACLMSVAVYLEFQHSRTPSDGV